MSFINSLLESRFLRTCSAYSLAMGSAVTIKMSLVILMSMIFGLNDSQKFSIYFSFALVADFSSLLATYTSLNFLRCKTSSLFAFFLAGIGGTFLVYAIYIVNIKIYYAGLSMLGISFGFLRRNLMVISNDYLKTEFKEHQNEYGSLLHSMTTAISFIVVFALGSIIKFNKTLVMALPIFLIFISFLIFFQNQKHYIAEEIKELFQKIKDGRYKIRNFFIFLSLIISSTFASYLFILFSNLEITKNLPLFFILIFYIYLVLRALKNPDERKSIFLAIGMAIVVILYLGVERQKDMSVALFLQRNISVKILDIQISPLQINALYQLATIIISFFCVKYKIHSKLNHKKVALMALLFSSLAFFSLFLGCYFANSDCIANFYFYLVFLLLMSGCNVLIITKFFEICRLMPESIKHTMSSFMIMNMGIAFYFAKLYSGLIAIDNENFDRFYSLEIYKNGFLKIFIINLFLTIGVFIFLNIKKKISKFKIKNQSIIFQGDNLL
jgi:hypothetical protein